MRLYTLFRWQISSQKYCICIYTVLASPIFDAHDKVLAHACECALAYNANKTVRVRAGARATLRQEKGITPQAVKATPHIN